mmetsp:Transcript_2928/g.4530  ORF Transcript_2928/g.4530 Transcript_2928/m.4530 type:complete len:238 (-) Transcript_2928:314-1027(-)
MTTKMSTLKKMAAASHCRHCVAVTPSFLNHACPKSSPSSLLPTRRTASSCSTFNAIPPIQNNRHQHHQHNHFHASHSDYDSIMNTVHNIGSSIPSIMEHLQNNDDDTDGIVDWGTRKDWVISTVTATASSMCSTSYSHVQTQNYDEDYDEDHLHMSHTEATKSDFENLTELERCGHEDVFDVQETRRILWGTTGDSYEGTLGGGGGGATVGETIIPWGIWDSETTDGDDVDHGVPTM